MFARRRSTLLSVVVPAYDVAAYLPACLDSVLAQAPSLGRVGLEVVVVDDGSPDESGAIADSYAARDPRVRVVHTENRGLGAARNEGLRHATGDLLAFADSDDMVPPGAYAALLKQLTRTGADFVVGSVARLEGTAEDPRLVEPPWMRRLHRQRMDLVIDDLPEILGDVFAWNKLFRTSFWRDTALSWPEGTRYEDQPTTTLAYLRARRFGLIPEVVYHWRIRSDGSSITQQRSSLDDLRDRWETKLTSLRSVEEYGAPKVTAMFRDRVLAGDLHRYFAELPGCDDAWWELLRTGVLSIWGSRSLTHSGLLPADRLVGWLVEQGRRAEAEAVVAYARDLGRPLDRVESADGRRLDLPADVLDVRTVAPAALEVRSTER
ncbi:MAG TPA: glycosyltransferase family 2 protein [Nocardioides bacterium]|uniref:glycosyltransferase family 2 protein n=1 Tax=uncultured Nocardioides sp. TaxID=198441 RepID=UPI000ED37FD5|nr:glycosyltransferase family 2 protein [uncultured Nocardioides sp.]HCB05954.1 glycosyltransferase family 2 protein [Nocardioides sp.]